MAEFIKPIATILSFLSLVLGSSLLIRIQSQKWILLMLPKMLANSLAFYVALIGVIAGIIGLFYGVPLAFITGIFGSIILFIYIHRVTAPHDGFEKAFGQGWQKKISLELKSRLRKKRWTWYIPSSPTPRWERNISFWTIPDSACGHPNRQLLCDIWRPRENIKSSGLAFIYFHGGGWHAMDKDFGTRPLFRSLAAQGHVVMDVAYRLCPEVNFYGMLGDVKRAIAWMKANSGQYGVDPERIVVAGGSAGAHLALLGAYTSDHPDLAPDEIKNADLSVKAVVSYYGPTDLRAFFCEGYGRVNPQARVERMEKNLLGGLIDEIPMLYDNAAPISHISPNRPPTLLFQGAHDCGVPVHSARFFYHKLVDAGIPAIYVEFPQTEHGFDIQMKFLKLGDCSQYSPAAQAALYDTEYFLALMASMN